MMADYYENDVRGHNQVANYGAYSFILPNVKDLNSSIQITAKTDKSLTIVGVHLDENNKSTPTGIENNFFFHTKANESTTFTIDQSELTGGFFITLLNPHDWNVTLIDFNVSKQSRFIKLTNDDRSYVYDTNTSLLWEDMDEGLKTWNDAKLYCQNLWMYQYEQEESWRLPTFQELLTIFNRDSANHVYEEFETLSDKPYGYWSSHVFLGEDGMVLSFINASYSIWDINLYPMNVICVTDFVQ